MTIRSFGPHIVSNASVDHPQVDDLFADGRKAKIYYSDPPWGEGNTKYWATMATKNTGQTIPSIGYEALINRIMGLIKTHVYGQVFIETGLRWEEDTIQRMKAIGLSNIETARLLYNGGGKKLENVIIFGSFDGSVGDLKRVAGMTGQKVAELAVAPFAEPGAILFDGCCGMGYSAAAAIAHGMEFRGNELNAVRLEKTIARLEKAL